MGQDHEIVGTVGTPTPNSLFLHNFRLFPLGKPEWEHVGTVGTGRPERSHSTACGNRFLSLWERRKLQKSKMLLDRFPLFPLFPRFW